MSNIKALLAVFLITYFLNASITDSTQATNEELAVIFANSIEQGTITLGEFEAGAQLGLDQRLWDGIIEGNYSEEEVRILFDNIPPESVLSKQVKDVISYLEASNTVDLEGYYELINYRNSVIGFAPLS